MLKRWISNFKKKNRSKFYNLGIKLIIVAIIIFIATVIISIRGNNQNEENENKSVYNPTSTVISGKNITEEKYEENKNIVDKFMQYCNEKNVQAAYDMLSEECKENQYKDIEVFNKIIIKQIFNTKRTYNIQSWVNNSKFNVYRIRITEDLLATGNYDNTKKYETYITTYPNSEKISIGEYICKEEINKKNSTDIVEAVVVNKIIYIDQEEYEIKIKNLSNKEILIDNLKDNKTIRLYGKDGNAYTPYYDKLYNSNLSVLPGETITLKIKFKKSIASYIESKEIKLSGIITDYESYKNSQENYKEALKGINIKF